LIQVGSANQKDCTEPSASSSTTGPTGKIEKSRANSRNTTSIEKKNKETIQNFAQVGLMRHA